jgi:hypothetical protein
MWNADQIASPTVDVEFLQKLLEIFKKYPDAGRKYSALDSLNIHSRRTTGFRESRAIALSPEAITRAVSGKRSADDTCAVCDAQSDVAQAEMG